MRELVPLALALIDLCGGAPEAVSLCRDLVSRGTAALDIAKGDGRIVIEQELVALGLVDSRGAPEASRCADLLILCDVLAALPTPVTREIEPPMLVYTVPDEARALITPGQRLDLLIEHLIRMATRSVHLGGPFWNDPGFDRLLSVLQPAVNDRGVTCTFYVHAWPDEQRRAYLRDRITDVGPSSRVNVWWYVGPAESLMHAKFVVRDCVEGYLGTANLTSHGFEQHVELGLPLLEQQSTDLIGFLDTLVSAGLFTSSSG